MLDPGLDMSVQESETEVKEEICKICLSKTIVEENLSTVLESLAIYNTITSEYLLDPKTDYETAKVMIDDLLSATQKMSEIVSLSTESIEKLKNCDCGTNEEQTSETSLD